MVLDDTLENVTFNLIKQAVIYLPLDVKNKLQEAYSAETGEIAKTQLKTILYNVFLAEKFQRPLCQDTGTLSFYVKVGTKFPNIENIEHTLIKATRKATTEIPLRPNAVDPFTQKNSEDNTGRYFPQICWEIVSGKSLELSVLVKGGGSENVSCLGMINPREGLKNLKRFVIEAVIKAGAKPCPPTILGIGVGGGVDTAIYLAKKSLLKPLDESNAEPKIAQLEQELFTALNMTEIGPMGLGGKTTVLGVHVDYAFRHPASFPVAINFNCWALRRASALIKSDCSVDYLTKHEKDKH